MTEVGCASARNGFRFRYFAANGVKCIAAMTPRRCAEPMRKMGPEVGLALAERDRTHGLPGTNRSPTTEDDGHGRYRGLKNLDIRWPRTVANKHNVTSTGSACRCGSHANDRARRYGRSAAHANPRTVAHSRSSDAHAAPFHRVRQRCGTGRAPARPNGFDPPPGETPESPNIRMTVMRISIFKDGAIRDDIQITSVDRRRARIDTWHTQKTRLRRARRVVKPLRRPQHRRSVPMSTAERREARCHRLRGGGTGGPGGSAAQGGQSERAHADVAVGRARWRCPPCNVGTSLACTRSNNAINHQQPMIEHS